MIGGDNIPSTEEDPRPSETLEPNEVSSQVIKSDDKGNDSSSSIQEESEPALSFKSSDALAKGISSMLGAFIRDFDSKAENAAKSQDQLSFAIDRLTGELDQLLEDAPLPFIMQHASKISGVRKRVSSLNFVLKSIQRRIDNMDRLLSTGLSHEKALAENSGQNQPSLGDTGTNSIFIVTACTTRYEYCPYFSSSTSLGASDYGTLT